MNSDAVTTEKPEETVEITFDLSKITLDEILDVFEMADKDASQLGKSETIALLRSMRKCIVKSSRPVTGADLQPVVQQFVMMVISGGPNGKN